MCPCTLLAYPGIIPYWMNVCVMCLLHVPADIRSLWIYVYHGVQGCLYHYRVEISTGLGMLQANSLPPVSNAIVIGIRKKGYSLSPAVLSNKTILST